jgi:hypothetical protein
LIFIVFPKEYNVSVGREVCYWPEGLEISTVWKESRIIDLRWKISDVLNHTR